MDNLLNEYEKLLQDIDTLNERLQFFENNKDNISREDYVKNVNSINRFLELNIERLNDIKARFISSIDDLINSISMGLEARKDLDQDQLDNNDDEIEMEDEEEIEYDIVPTIISEKMYRTEYPRDDKEFIRLHLHECINPDTNQFFTDSEIDNIINDCRLASDGAYDDGYDNPISEVVIIYDKKVAKEKEKEKEKKKVKKIIKEKKKIEAIESEIIADNIDRIEFPREDKDFIRVQLANIINPETGVMFTSEEIESIIDECRLASDGAYDDGYDNPLSKVSIIRDKKVIKEIEVDKEIEVEEDEDELEIEEDTKTNNLPIPVNEVLLYRDNANDQFYVRKTDAEILNLNVLNRKVRVNGVICVEITPEVAQLVVDNQRNSYYPYNVVEKEIELVRSYTNNNVNNNDKILKLDNNHNNVPLLEDKNKNNNDKDSDLINALNNLLNQIDEDELEEENDNSINLDEDGDSSNDDDSISLTDSNDSALLNQVNDLLNDIDEDDLEDENDDVLGTDDDSSDNSNNENEEEDENNAVIDSDDDSSNNSNNNEEENDNKASKDGEDFETITLVSDVDRLEYPRDDKDFIRSVLLNTINPDTGKNWTNEEIDKIIDKCRFVTDGAYDDGYDNPLVKGDIVYDKPKKKEKPKPPKPPKPPKTKVDLKLDWEIMAQRLNDRTIAKLSDDEVKLYDEIMSTKIGKFNAYKDTVKYSDKMASITKQSKLKKKKKYGIDKFFETIGALGRKAGATVGHVKNKFVRIFSKVKDNEADVWAKYLEAIENCSDAEKEWMYENINATTVLNGHFTDIQIKNICDVLYKFKMKQMQPKRDEYYALYYALINLGKDLSEGKKVDTSRVPEMINRWKDLEGELSRFYSVSLDRFDKVLGDVKSKMSMQGEHYAARVKSDKDSHKELYDLNKKMQEAAASGKCDEALLYFLKHETLAEDKEIMTSNILGEKFDGGLYHETNIGALNHETDNHWLNVVRLAMVGVQAVAIGANVAQKISQIQEIARSNAENIKIGNHNKGIIDQQHQALIDIQKHEQAVASAIDPARSGYYDAVRSAVASSTEIGGQAMAGKQNGFILSLTGAYKSQFDPMMHTCNEAIQQAINGLQGVTTQQALSSGLAGLHSACSNELQTVINALSSTATQMNTYQLARYNAFVDMVNSMPTVESFFTNTAASMSQIDAIINNAMHLGSYLGPDTCGTMLNYLPELAQGLSLIGLVATTSKKEQHNRDLYDDQVKEMLDEVDRDKLDEVLENNGLSK